MYVLSTFKPFKDSSRKGVIEWRRNNPSQELTKKKFPALLKVVISKSVRPKLIINSFKACRLYPWNSSSIDFSKFLKKRKPQYSILFHIVDILTFGEFKENIDANNIKKITQTDVQSERNGDTILYQMWQEFYHITGEETQKEATIMTFF